MVDSVALAQMTPRERLSVILSRHAMPILLSLLIGLSIVGFLGFRIYGQFETERVADVRNLSASIDALGAAVTEAETLKPISTATAR